MVPRSSGSEPFPRPPIGLSPAVRGESCHLLNEILADSLVLTALYKKHHWLVAGPTFYQLHLLFDKHAAQQNELVDPDPPSASRASEGSPSATRATRPS